MKILKDTRRIKKYAEWRKKIFLRDFNTCQYCWHPLSGRQRFAHHIRLWDEFPALRFDASNGLTLCHSCHTKWHKSGTRHSADAKAKMSAAAMGRKFSAETRAKISAANKGNTNCIGYKHSEEARAKISATGKGRVCSEETKAKMSASLKKAWAVRKSMVKT